MKEEKGKCRHCGRTVWFLIVSHDAFTHEPVRQWVAVDGSLPAPAYCPELSKGHRTAYHEAEEDA